MFTSQQLKSLKELKQEITINSIERRYMYLGILTEYQLYLKNPKQTIIYTKLNPQQHFLFKRVLHGTNIYDKEELNKMHWDKKRRITKVWKRAQSEINRWKQTICNESANSFFKVFYNSTLAKGILDIPASETCDEHKNTISFKDLGIKYEDVILLFMGKGLLPKNFLSLK